MRREICLNQETESFQAIGRLAVALVLVQLAREDSVAAEKAFKEWGNCCDQNEVQTLEVLLQVILILFVSSNHCCIRLMDVVDTLYWDSTCKVKDAG